MSHKLFHWPGNWWNVLQNALNYYCIINLEWQVKSEEWGVKSVLRMVSSGKSWTLWWSPWFISDLLRQSNSNATLPVSVAIGSYFLFQWWLIHSIPFDSIRFKFTYTSIIIMREKHFHWKWSRGRICKTNRLPVCDWRWIRFERQPFIWSAIKQTRSENVDTTPRHLAATPPQRTAETVYYLDFRSRI